MLFHRKKIRWQVSFIVVILSGALVLVFARSRTHFSGSDEASTSSAAATDNASQTLSPPASRNLSLQPEAFKLSRRLGQRFQSPRREVSVLGGALTSGNQRQPIQIIRSQTERGERVEIALGVGTPLLTWSESEGSGSSGGVLNDTQRILIERLALDSIDQFVLAQLRGASYYTIARNVRPPDAVESDNYAGPLWDIVRVDDPETDAQKAPLSGWRLFYINVNTGLIDKVVSELRGAEIEVNLSEWTQQDKERFPTVITWSRQGTVVMEFRLTSFTHESQP